jgi:hypothetical protein
VQFAIRQSFVILPLRLPSDFSFAESLVLWMELFLENHAKHARTVFMLVVYTRYVPTPPTIAPFFTISPVVQFKSFIELSIVSFGHILAPPILNCST